MGIMASRVSGLTIGLAIAATSVLGSGAMASEGCAAVNKGALNAQVSAGASVSRQIKLETGDTLSFTSDGASVAFTSGLGAPATLIADLTGSSSFRAPAGSSYGFKFTAAQDGGNVTVTCVSTLTEAANAAFLARRRDLLTSSGPDRLRIDRAPTPAVNTDKPLSSSVAVDDQGRAKDVQFSVSLSEIKAAAQGNRKIDPGIVDFWVEGRMQNYEAASIDTRLSGGNLGVLYFGTRSMIGPDIMVGALAQMDRGIETAATSAPTVAATGWMVGPYVSMKLGSGVTFDGRAAWGETENAVATPDIEDSLTARRLVRGKLTSTRQFGGWNVAPSVGLVYVEDAVRNSSTGEAMAAGTGRVEVLPEISKRIALDDQTFFEPRAALGAFVGFDDLRALNPKDASAQPTDVQLKAQAGFAVGVKDGASLQATGGVEGGPATTSENWTGRLQLNMPLGK